MILDYRNTTLDFSIDAPPSKSMYHRELIIRFLCGDYSHLGILDTDSEDIIATKSVLKAIYDATTCTDPTANENIHLPCNESGSTLRFMIPVAAAALLGMGRNHFGVKKLIFETKGRLFDRPMEELKKHMAPHGIIISEDAENRCFIVSGEMTPGTYSIEGGISSQYITGLLMALTVFDEPSTIEVIGDIASIHYIELTQSVLEKYNCPVEKSGNIYIPKAGGYKKYMEALNRKSLSESEFKVEGDWSNGAFLLCLSQWTRIKVGNLNMSSIQGDRAILDYLDKVNEARNSGQSEKIIEWNCTDIPDITPYMAVVAAFSFDKAVFTGISRLRIKESDRVSAVRNQLDAIGVMTEEDEDSLTVYRYNSSYDPKDGPIKLSSFHDHRMAMCAILIAAILKCEVEIDDIDCMKKSFPEFLNYLNITS